MAIDLFPKREMLVIVSSEWYRKQCNERPIVCKPVPIFCFSVIVIYIHGISQKRVKLILQKKNFLTV